MEPNGKPGGEPKRKKENEKAGWNYA